MIETVSSWLFIKVWVHGPHPSQWYPLTVSSSNGNPRSQSWELFLLIFSSSPQPSSLKRHPPKKWASDEATSSSWLNYPSEEWNAIAVNCKKYFRILYHHMNSLYKSFDSTQKLLVGSKRLNAGYIDFPRINPLVFCAIGDTKATQVMITVGLLPRGIWCRYNSHPPNEKPQSTPYSLFRSTFGLPCLRVSLKQGKHGKHVAFWWNSILSATVTAWTSWLFEDNIIGVSCKCQEYPRIIWGL